jgi:hypothetical protein
MRGFVFQGASDDIRSKSNNIQATFRIANHRYPKSHLPMLDMAGTTNPEVKP